MTVDFPDSSIIACICEGGAEIAIMDILLDNDLLKFTREQLIEEQVLPRMKVAEFQRRYLRREYEQKILILRVIDSRREEFKLSKAYRCQVEVINVITAPEIEILIIASKKISSFLLKADSHTKGVGICLFGGLTTDKGGTADRPSLSALPAL